MSGKRAKIRRVPYRKQNSIAEIVSTMESFLVAGVGFEPHDLRVMSPTSYRTALPRDILLLPAWHPSLNGAGDRDRTGTILTYHGILSPGRLPVPPHRHSSTGRLAYLFGSHSLLYHIPSSLSSPFSHFFIFSPSSLFFPPPSLSIHPSGTKTSPPLSSRTPSLIPPPSVFRSSWHSAPRKNHSHTSPSAFRYSLQRHRNRSCLHSPESRCSPNAYTRKKQTIQSL